MAPLDPTTGVVRVSYQYYTDTALAGLLQSVTDANGGVTQYKYYVNRRGRKVTDADGNTQSISFNLYRDRTTLLDERQALTSYDHDSSGNIIKQVNADQTTAAYTWQRTASRCRPPMPSGRRPTTIMMPTANRSDAADPLANLTSICSTRPTPLTRTLADDPPAVAHATDTCRAVTARGTTRLTTAIPARPRS